MGIQGLHDACRGSKKKVHVRDYAGMRLAADGYGWLHRGCYSCALHLAQGQQPWLRYGRPPPYVEFCLHRVRFLEGCRRRCLPPQPPDAIPPPQMRMLRHFGVIPCLVFDGDSLPAKEGTDAARKAGRTAKLARARELLAGGDRAAAETLFQQCISVTPAMAHAVILALEAERFAHLTVRNQHRCACASSVLRLTRASAFFVFYFLAGAVRSGRPARAPRPLRPGGCGGNRGRRPGGTAGFAHTQRGQFCLKDSSLNSCSAGLRLPHRRLQAGQVRQRHRAAA